MPDPANAAYADAVVRCAAGLVEISGGGANLLFTSHRALEAAARSLRAQWAQRPGGPFHLLVQGEAPREQLLREFREHGDAVLLRTASFWEGVDVRGSALRLVVITFILQRFRARLRFFPLSQQSLAIGALLLNDRIVTVALHFVLGEPMPGLLSWIAPALGMVLWAPLFWLLDLLRLKAWRHR
jgi:hypothetical protein